MEFQSLAQSIERSLPKGWKVVESQPTPEAMDQCVRTAMEQGVQRIVVVMTQPWFSRASSGKSLTVLYQCLARLAPNLQVEVRTSWADDSAYIEALVEQINASAERSGADMATASVALMGDWCDENTDGWNMEQEQTAVLVAQQLGWTSDRVYAVENPYAEVADPSVISCSLNLCPERLAKVLTLLVRRGRHAMIPTQAPARLRAASRVVTDLQSLTQGLVMLGASVAGAIPGSEIGGVRCCGNEEFLTIKRPHLETMDLLRELQGQGTLQECFIFNTCHRFEVYGWFAEGSEAAQDKLRRMVGREQASSLVCVHGRDAWRHLLRTSAGLNSGLIGDTDVIDQLESGLRAAQHIDVAGPLCATLVERVISKVHELRDRTPWGRYAHRYAETAIIHLPTDVQQLIARGRITVVGGSTTSASLVETFRNFYSIPAERITLLYRGHRRGILMNRLMRAIGENQMVRVEDYAEEKVERLVAEADVAFLASDNREQALESGRLLEVRSALRGPAAPELLGIDFNSFGSIRNPDTKGLRMIDAHALADVVNTFNRRTLKDPQFALALDEAEEWIARESEHVWKRQTRQLGTEVLA